MEDLIIIAVIAVLVVVGIRPSIKHFKGQGGCCGGSAPAKKSRKKLKSVLQTKILIIEGMTCEHCSARVEQAVNGIDGAAAKVNLKKKEAVVLLERQVSDEVLRAAVEKAGYRVTEIK